MGFKINGIPVAGLGLPGKDGVNGADGRSAYQIAQDGGYQGSEAEFAELLATAASQSYVEQEIGEHNQDENAHSDIRQAVTSAASAATNAQNAANSKMSTDFSNASAVLSAAMGGTGVTSLSALATALGAAKFATGNYTGTDTSGSSNPNRINLSFAPKFVIVARADGGDREQSLRAIYGMTVASSFESNKSQLTWGANYFSWYADNASYQLNYSGLPYRWIAFG